MQVIKCSQSHYTVPNSNYQPALILRLPKKTISQYLPSNHSPYTMKEIKYCIFSCLDDVITERKAKA